MTKHLTIRLNWNEEQTLGQLCEQDFRPPELQIRRLIAEEARRRGIEVALDLRILSGPRAEGALVGEPS